ncbi:rhotekin-2-like isoform X1 [Dermacentor andersoni]|uniref:rhotekin-2-like isoform X1 n=1 Tax=Dermacentor andersoni TaxID=34620 RepID=UPI0024159DE2|nr:rhotekin-2-like isoform X1 [Dermacentor andersoni]
MAPTLKARRRGVNSKDKIENNFEYLRFLSDSRKERLRRRRTLSGRKEYDLEQKIDLEIKMREGTTKLLAVCQHRPQSLEAAKSLLTSNERMAAYVAELQRRKTAERPKQSIGGFPLELSRSRVAVSEIRMPLIWKDTDHFKNKGDYRRFAVFCLLKIGTEIYDTAMVSNVDRSMTDVSFDDTIVFNNIPPDFEFKLEVYSHILQDDLSMASTPRKIKTKITNSVSRAIGRKLAASLKEELNSFEIGPKFELEAHATLRLSDADDKAHTYDLTMESLENPQLQLPLFGHFCCKLAVVPDCTHEEQLSGYLGVVQLANGVSGRRRLWCVLKNFQLCLWTSPEDARHLPPVLSIPINMDTHLRTDNCSSKYMHAIRIISAIADKVQEHLIVADGEQDFTKWLLHLRQHIKDHELWGNLASKRMEIPSPGPRRAPMFLHARQTSLYDETSLKESPQGLAGSAVQDNAQRISPTSVRSRSSSTSSASSSVSGSRNFPLLPARKAFGYF